MSLPKALFFTALLLFGYIGISAYLKSEKVTEINISTEEIPLTSIENSISVVEQKPLESSFLEKDKIETKVAVIEDPSLDVDRIQEFFNISSPKFPVVETISYKSKTNWMKDRPAWLSDYSSHFKTSRHFIARSLNGKADYLKQDVSEGQKFNILKPGKNISFHLLVNIDKCKMWFYYNDLDENQKILVKTYPVGLGRVDTSKSSGLLTPLGTYSLGSRIAIFKPKEIGNHNNEKVEMVRVFGTRWIPFEKEIADTTAPAKGFGLHGTPWVVKNGTLKEDIESLGKYESDGCIRMAKADIEELFAIIISRPTLIEIVKN